MHNQGGKPKFDVESPSSEGGDSAMKQEYLAALRQQEENEYLRF